MTDDGDRGGAWRDEDLASEVGDALGRLDPVPPNLLATVQASFALRTLDAELATLLDNADDADDHTNGVLVRGGGVSGPNMLTFESPAVTLELEVVADGRRRRILGQVVPPQRATIEVRHRDGTLAVEADEVGRFDVGDVAPGPVVVRCRRPGELPTVVETDWFVA